MADFKLAAIGLDTSHTVAFTTLLQGDKTPEDQKITGLKVIHAMRFPSAFQAEEGQNQRQAQLEAMGVKMATTFKDAIQGVDGILLELNDPATHLEWAEKAIETKLPIFLDKPLASSLDEGKRIIELAKKHNVRLWTASSCRFFESLVKAKTDVPEPSFCNVFGALGQAAKGSDVIWYGVHAVEMLNALMGRGAQTVFAKADDLGIVALVNFSGGRRGIVELNRKTGMYGGRLQNKDACKYFLSSTDPKPLYWYQMVKLKEFFLDGKQPVELEDSLEAQAILDAIDTSLKSGGSVAVSL
ncbi:MAG: Gfo/Idh/MocA family oxidoreductase [Planctomycetota bacterium]